MFQLRTEMFQLRTEMFQLWLNVPIVDWMFQLCDWVFESMHALVISSGFVNLTAYVEFTVNSTSLGALISLYPAQKELV